MNRLSLKKIKISYRYRSSPKPSSYTPLLPVPVILPDLVSAKCIYKYNSMFFKIVYIYLRGGMYVYFL